ncbi:protein SNOWY COTYLEDON 3-like [Panicum miliaceum]|uniref:Protein SNOWY COTYLEDON 3-like n=1 Tax=Panicum miliaceum TaxID=4540 RepID=A0A3L6QRS8_PANMI|nr:protein SNOWY COTYLEDON 3-like [Panicum miliaceum]
MVDATLAAPPLDLTARRRARPAALSNANANANANACAGAVAAAPNKPKSKTVASRYLTPSPKPTSISSSASAPAPRPASTERPRPAHPNAVATTDAAASCGSATTTTRTLAVAFQSPAYSLDTSRGRSASPAVVPAAAPEKRRSGAAGVAARAKVSDASQNAYRWPASATPPPCGHDARAPAKSPGYYSASGRKGSAAAIFGAVRAAALHGAPRRASVDGANEYLLALSSDDTDSASSGDGVAPRRSVGSGPRPSPRTAMSSSARFTRDAMGIHSERFGSVASPAPAPVKKRSLFNGLLSSPFGRSSLKQHPPSKPVASSFRRTASPSPGRRSTDGPGSAGNMQGKASSTGCGFDGADTMKLKPPAAVKAEEEHQLRLRYTQHLQWRLVNAQAGAALSLQTAAAEKTLSGAWITILRMRKSVAIRKMQLQLLRNNCKLMSVLRGQMKYLEEWSFLERDYAHSLSGTTQALNATVLRLPVSNGAMADIQGIKKALSSAVDVMDTIGNSTSTRLPKLARTNVLASQLSKVFIQEHILIAQCRDLLSTLASMHVKYSSLQGQRIQMNQRRRQYFQ